MRKKIACGAFKWVWISSFLLSVWFVTACAGCAKSDETQEAAEGGADSFQEEGKADEGGKEMNQTTQLTGNLQPMEDLSSAELVKKLQAGWNLGNTLDCISDGLTGGPAQYEMAWGNPKTSREMIDLVKEAGFQVLRIPVSWKDHIVKNEDALILENWMDRVQEVVDYGIDNDLYVILNLHHEDWHFPSYENLESASGELAKVWGQIAARFAGYDEHLIFEGMNEPRMSGTEYEWIGGTEEARNVINRFNQVFVETIRQSGGNNAKRHLMIPAYAAASDSKVLKALEIPEDDKIIVSVHAYTPYDFALNTKGTDRWSAENSADTKDIDTLFQVLDDLFLKKGIPVIIGEFGAMNKNNTEARIEWAGYYMAKARAHGVPCIWWDNGAFEGDGENFGLMDRRKVSWAYPDLVSVLTGKEE